MRNHKNRPTGSTPLPEVNEVYSHYSKRGKGRGPVRGRGRGRGRGHGQGRNFSAVNHPTKKNNHQKWKGPRANGSETECYRCGGKGHWANMCRIPKYLVELYQAFLKDKAHEANFVYDNEFDITHLDVADIFEHLDGKLNHSIGDGSMVKDD
nr:AT-hook motif nuclear-localized protein 4-like [Nicotiana tomentosiformis]